MDDYATPKPIYAALDAEFHFTDDPCKLGGVKDADGLIREWGASTFVNPPYSNPSRWCEKAVLEMKRGKVVVMLLRVDTSTRWFHDWVLPYAEIRWIRGRLKFNGKTGAPFASMIAVYSLAEACKP